MSHWDTRSEVEIATEAVFEAFKLFDHAKLQSKSYKGDRDIVTDADVTLERELASFISSRSVDIPILGEELSPDIAGNNYWTIDPIDGTINATRSIPLCGVSIGVVRNGVPTVGAIGLFDNKLVLSGSEETGLITHPTQNVRKRSGSLRDSVIAVGDFPTSSSLRNNSDFAYNILGRLKDRSLRIRMLGSAVIDMAYLSIGSIDASLTWSNNPWDVAAGVAIAKAAGCTILDESGSPYTTNSKCVFAFEPSLYEELSKTIGLFSGMDNE